MSSVFDISSLRLAPQGVKSVINFATKKPPVAEEANLAAWQKCERIRSEGSAAPVSVMGEFGIKQLVQESNTFGYPDRSDAWIDETERFEWPGLLQNNAGAEVNAGRIK